MTTQTLGSRRLASLIRKHVLDHTFTVEYYRIGMTWAGRPYNQLSMRDRRVKYTVCEAHEVALEGWKFLGEGWSRQAWLGPDGVVYKVSKDAKSHTGRTAMNCNRSESDRYKEMAEKVASHGFRLAPARLLWPTVIAMEFVPKTGDVEWNVMCNIEKHTGISDLHTGNVWLDSNKVPTLIDYAG